MALEAARIASHGRSSNGTRIERRSMVARCRTSDAVGEHGRVSGRYHGAEGCPRKGRKGERGENRIPEHNQPRIADAVDGGAWVQCVLAQARNTPNLHGSCENR